MSRTRILLAIMVAAELELASRSRVYTNSIVVTATNSVLKVVSAEAYSKHGINAHGIIIDELHAQPNRELVDVLVTSTGARRQPLIIYITTADFDRESICNEKYEYACKVRDGVIDDPAFLPVIYEATPDEDWTDPAVWAKANPNLGISVSEEYLKRECQRARETPTYENTFTRRTDSLIPPEGLQCPRRERFCSFTPPLGESWPPCDENRRCRPGSLLLICTDIPTATGSCFG